MESHGFCCSFCIIHEDMKTAEGASACLRVTVVMDFELFLEDVRR